MPVMEKDLAEDAPWKKIQQNPFARWCKEHLKCVNKRIRNLSQKPMYRKHHQRPTFRQTQLENVSVGARVPGP
jgi:filamin